MRRSFSEKRRAFILTLLLIVAATASVRSFSLVPHQANNFHLRPSSSNRSPPRPVSIPSQERRRVSPLFASYNDDDVDNDEEIEDGARPFKRPTDSLVAEASMRLKRISWLSWWSQMILTVTSAVILMFARNVVTGVRKDAQVNFLLAGSGIVVSFVSIFWTWGGGARLSRRLLRKPTPRIQAATMLRRSISVGVSLNLAGMALTLLGAEQTVGILAIKVLTARPWNNAGGMPLMATNDGLQPLDILVVQANTNVLFSHFCSLVALLYLTRFIKKLDPPSVGDYERAR